MVSEILRSNKNIFSKRKCYIIFFVKNTNIRTLRNLNDTALYDAYIFFLLPRILSIIQNITGGVQ